MVAMDIEVAPGRAGVGTEQMLAVPVASRMNFDIFQKVGVGAAVRVGGHLAGASAYLSLLTSDGGSLRVVAGPDLALDHLTALEGTFVELIGTKAGDAELRAVGAVA